MLMVIFRWMGASVNTEENVVAIVIVHHTFAMRVTADGVVITGSVSLSAVENETCLNKPVVLAIRNELTFFKEVFPFPFFFIADENQ